MQVLCGCGWAADNVGRRLTTDVGPSDGDYPAAAAMYVRLLTRRVERAGAVGRAAYFVDVCRDDAGECRVGVVRGLARAAVRVCAHAAGDRRVWRPACVCAHVLARVHAELCGGDRRRRQHADRWHALPRIHPADQALLPDGAVGVLCAGLRALCGPGAAPAPREQLHALLALCAGGTQRRVAASRPGARYRGRSACLHRRRSLAWCVCGRSVWKKA